MLLFSKCSVCQSIVVCELSSDEMETSHNWIEISLAIGQF